MFSWEAIISKLRSCQELLDKCESNVSSVRTTVRPHPLIKKPPGEYERNEDRIRLSAV